MRIGIFGGTFDPVHNEHYNICISAIKEFGLEKTVVIPSGTPPHKVPGKLTAGKDDRYVMAETAFKGVKGIEFSRYENEKDKPGYTYVTMRHFKEIYPDDELFLIIGADSLIDFRKWKNPEKILKCCRLIVCGREGYGEYFKEAKNIEKEYGTQVLMCSYKGAKISSTAIKVFLEFGMDCRGMLNAEVLSYIKEKGLYTNYREYIEKLKEMLSEKRYIHTVYTVIEALRLARITGCDPDKTFIAAALHDCTKKLTYDKLKGMGFVLKNKVPEPVVHSLSGSFAARVIFGVKDRDILNSIRYHTTARPGMSPLEKVIYVADCIEETREYEGVDILRKKVYENFEKGFIACMEATIQLLKLKENREEVSDLTLKAYDYYKRNNNSK